MDLKKIPVARVVRMPTGAHAAGGKVVICPTLSYLSNKPVAVAEMTPDEALLLACSLIEAARAATRRRSRS